MSRLAEGLRLAQEPDGRIVIGDGGLQLVVEQEEGGQVGVTLYDGDDLVGRLLIARDAVEVIQAGRVAGVLIEWGR